ncbi:hypothetical protein [Xenorhabdus anantnagensis]|uniref:Uncharacterized protein n=1 Tax=Xenorhabdus anantnagensis TaxID=3025875 RepID=A0ABT5LVK1_9GAMM|nr:hypothetical protein [Xenorhabdus anantnagensis]MDC9598453.1 hypothetical protein [Xenorhabdus anantnagensis]
MDTATRMTSFEDCSGTNSCKFIIYGLSRMSPVAIMLLGTGTLAGIVANSECYSLEYLALLVRGARKYASESRGN